MSVLERALTRQSLSETSLQAAGRSLAEAEAALNLHRACAGERCTGIYLLQLPPQERSKILAQLGAGAVGVGDANTAETDLLFYLQIMERAVANAKAPFPKRLQVANDAGPQIVRTAREKKLPVSARLLPALVLLTEAQAESAARLRAARTALAVERFRAAKQSLPEALDQLTPEFLSAVPADPFVGSSLRFKKLAKGYVIYSVGRDRRDDGGKERAEGGKSDEDTDVTFAVEK